MPRLTKIYTQTGDRGETGLVAGKRVSKDSPRIWAAGTVDELNSAIGLACAGKPDRQTAAILPQIQNDLFNLGAELATLPADFKVGMPRIEPHQIVAQCDAGTLGRIYPAWRNGGGGAAARGSDGLPARRTVVRAVGPPREDWRMRCAVFKPLGRRLVCVGPLDQLQSPPSGNGVAETRD